VSLKVSDGGCRVQQPGGHLTLMVVLVCPSFDIYLAHKLSILGSPLKMSRIERKELEAPSESSGRVT
jgi:hypothetical protein